MKVLDSFIYRYISSNLKEGLTWHKQTNKWLVRTYITGDVIYLGLYTHKHLAAHEYIKFVSKQLNKSISSIVLTKPEQGACRGARIKSGKWIVEIGNRRLQVDNERTAYRILKKPIPHMFIVSENFKIYFL